MTDGGFVGFRRRYDARGNEVEQTHLDLDGRPVLTKEHYATAVSTYDDQGKKVSLSYFDDAGRPLRTAVVVSNVEAEGQFGKLGLRVDDVLLRYDNKDLTDGFSFLHGRTLEPKGGPKRKLVVLRGEDLITLELSTEILGCALITRVATAKEVAASRKVTPERVPVEGASQPGASEASGPK